MTREKTKIIPLTSNTMFKEIFGRDENKEMTAYLISQYFELDYNFVLDNIIHQNTIQSINNLKDYSYDVDIILSLNNEVLINVEMNKYFWDGIENRNLSYFTKIFSSQYEKGKGREQFRESKKCIQINFNNYNKPKDKERTIYRFRDVETNEELTDRIEIHHVNLEVIKNGCYNKSNEELSVLEKIVMCLKTNDVDDMEKIVGGRMKSILDKVMELSKDERLIGLYNTEELAKTREYGMKMAGIEEGMEKRIQKSIEQKERQVVINMLNDNLDLNIISKYTDLSIDEISKIKLENNIN